MERLYKKAEELGYTEDQAIEALERWKAYQEKKKELARNYYLKNKDKLDEYHRTYRQSHPDYRDKVKQRAKQV